MKYTLTKSDGRRALADVLRLARKPGDLIDAENIELDLPGPWAYPDLGYRMLAAEVDLNLKNCRLYLPSDFAERRSLNTDSEQLVTRPDRDIPMLWCGRSSRVFAEGTRFIVNDEDFRDWNAGGIRFVDGGDWEFGGGCVFDGGHGLHTHTATERGLKLLSPHGSECFLLSSDGQPGRIRVSDVAFNVKVDGSYTSCCMIGGSKPLALTYKDRETGEIKPMDDTSMPNVEVVQCFGNDYWFAFSANVQLPPELWNISQAVRFAHCTSTGARHFFYNDTGHTSAHMWDCHPMATTYADVRMVGGVESNRRFLSLSECTLEADCAINLEGPAQSIVMVDSLSSVKSNRLAVIANSGHRVIVDDSNVLAGKCAFVPNTTDAVPPILI